jgi:hypothetical protein
VFGAHVTALDAGGVVRVGALTNPDGTFRIPSLPAGEYQVYAEPLDAPVIPDLLAEAYRDSRQPVLRSFRTAFAGGNTSPDAATVKAGQTVTLDPIRVDARAASINPLFMAWSPDGAAFRGASAPPLQIAPGETRFLALVGEGLAGVPGVGFSVSGAGLTVNRDRLRRGMTTTKQPYVIFPLSVRKGAPPGARSIYCVTRAERAALTGAIEVTAP